VFPCWPGSKEPATRHGFKDASCDLERIELFWQAHPDANLAVATGVPGIDVLDIDVKPDGDGFAALRRINATGLLVGAWARVQTPSGGRHYWFIGSQQPCRSFPRAHIDIKAKGGYVLVPPSMVNGRPYVLLETQEVWNNGYGPEPYPLDGNSINALLRPELFHRPGAGRTGHIDSLAAWLAEQPEGNQNTGLHWAACRALEAGASDEDLARLIDVYVGLSVPGHPRGPNTHTGGWATIDSARRRVGDAA
jgi:hypothetical protein